MKREIEDKIRVIKRWKKICGIISIAALIGIVLLVALEYVSARFFADAPWEQGVVRACIYILYVMPYIVVVPLFCRVNLSGKLYRLQQQLDGKEDEKC